MTARRSSGVRTVRALGAVALVALLAACGNNPSGQAVVVGSSTVPTSDIASAVDELRAQAAADTSATQPFDEGAATVAVVDREARSLLLDEAARREGITVTQGEVDQLIQTTVDQQFGGDRAALDNALATQQNIPASQVSDFARDFLVQKKLGEKIAPGADSQAASSAVITYLSALSRDVGVEIAPRFGTWDDKSIALGPAPDDLSVLAGTSSAS